MSNENKYLLQHVITLQTQSTKQKHTLYIANKGSYTKLECLSIRALVNKTNIYKFFKNCNLSLLVFVVM